jgi:hypothetical protein
MISFAVKYYKSLQDIEMLKTNLNRAQTLLVEAENNLAITKEQLSNEIHNSNKLSQELQNVTNELENALKTIEKNNQTHNGWKMYWREINLEEWEIDFFAKLLHCEAGVMGYEGQFWTASAMLNFSELNNISIWDMGHNENMFEVAPWVDDATPSQEQYDIIYEVLNNGWIADVCYFRTNQPHSFGTYMIKIENICFSSP